jgi:hypothetical protein
MAEKDDPVQPSPAHSLGNLPGRVRRLRSPLEHESGAGENHLPARKRVTWKRRIRPLVKTAQALEERR